MKRYLFGVFSVAVMLFTAGCDDFLDRPQLNSVQDSEKYWRNEVDFRTYSVEFYPWFFTGYNSGYGTTYTPLRGYTFNDDITSGEAKQTDFPSVVPTSVSSMRSPSQLLTGDWRTLYHGEMWNFGWVRKANIMIDRTEKYKANLSDAAYKHWMAVGRFFRAYAYYNLVITFGDVPYFDKPIDESDLVTMYKDRDPRGFVMDRIYDDLKYAIENSYLLDNSSTQYVNKYVIASVASRIMLFEGTWEKYHGLSAERSKKYLEFCKEASEVVINSKKYSCTRDFRSLFGSASLAGHPEVIFYRNYAAALVTHAIASYSNGEEGQSGVNLQLLKSFICNDGKPYKVSGVANASDFRMSELAKSRDSRLEATFYNFAHVKSQSLIYCDKFISREGASYWNKISQRPAQYGSNLNENDAPVLRYAEVLLNWIEAKAELAQTYGGDPVTQVDIDLSINAIRNRPLDAAAIANGVSKTAPLILATMVDDPDRDADVPQLIWEIRRERRMEFVYEHTRLLDIKRWKKIDYMDNAKYPDTMYGPWVNFSAEVPAYLSKAYEGNLIVRKADGTLVTYNGTNGSQMVGFYKIRKATPRNAYDYAKAYLSPIGSQEIQAYTNLGFTLTQTQGW